MLQNGRNLCSSEHCHCDRNANAQGHSCALQPLPTDNSIPGLSCCHTPSGRSSIVTTSRFNIIPPTKHHNHIDYHVEPIPMDIDNPDDIENNIPEGITGLEAEIDQTIPGVRVVPPKGKAKRYENSVSYFYFSNCMVFTWSHISKDVPLKTWMDKHRDEYLDECLALEGRGRFGKRCAGCIETFPQYCCRDCTHGSLWCQRCLVKQHRDNPLHVVQVCLGAVSPSFTHLLILRRCGTACFFSAQLFWD